jgi:hypothetical protein
MTYVLETPNGDIIKINPDVQLEFKISKDDPHTLICTNYDELYQETRDYNIFSTLNDVGFMNDFINILDNDYTWNKSIPEGSNMTQHYGTLLNVIKGECIKKQKEFEKCLLIVSADILPILCFNDFDHSSGIPTQGSYICGTLQGRQVYVCPCITPGCICVFEESSGNIVCKIGITK